MPCSKAARIVAMDSASSVPPHIQPPIAHVPIATGDTLIDVPGMLVNSILVLRASACSVMILFLSSKSARPEGEQRTSPYSVGGHGGDGVEPRLLLGDQRERCPVENAVPARDSRDQPVPHHAH